MTIVKLFIPFLNDILSDHAFQTKKGVFYHYISNLNQFRPWKIRYKNIHGETVKIDPKTLELDTEVIRF